MSARYQAVLFDLLTALLDSWSVWERAAPSPERGRAWRAEYLRRTYACGVYQPYESLVAEAAEAVGLDAEYANRLQAAWTMLEPWADAVPTLCSLRATHRLGIATNCSERLGRMAADRLGVPFDVVVTAERAQWYKPDPRQYRLAP